MSMLITNLRILSKSYMKPYIPIAITIWWERAWMIMMVIVIKLDF